MKKLVILFGIYILSALQIGCTKQATQEPTSIQSTIIYAVDDLSSTHASAEKMNADLLVETAKVFFEQQQQVTLLANHVSQPFPAPVVLQLESFKGSMEKMSIHYKAQLEKKIVVDSLNEVNLQDFSTRFDEDITNFELIKGKTDYSYINVHARAIHHFLLAKEDSTTLRIAVLASDLIDDEPNKKAAYIDSSSVQLLNKALATPNTHLFVITTTATTDAPTIKALNATFLNSWTEFKLRTESLFSNPNLASHD